MHDSVHCAYRADGIHSGATLFHLFIELNIVPDFRIDTRFIHGSAWTKTAASQWIPAHAFDRGMKLTFVRGELLQDPNACTGAQYSHQITWLHLLVHELCQRPACKVEAFQRQSKVVNHECNRASHLFAL